MKRVRMLILSAAFVLSAFSFAFADIAAPKDPISEATNGSLSTFGAIAAVAIAGVLAFVYSKNKK